MPPDLDGWPQTPRPSIVELARLLTGNWEGDALVVDTIGFNGKSWLDFFGHPQSESMHLTERYHRRDSKMYLKPFSLKVSHILPADSDILEDVCGKNEKDRAHMGY